MEEKWWEEAPLANEENATPTVEQPEGDNWWEEAPLATAPEDQVDNTGVPGQSQAATEAQIAEGELPNDQRPLDEVLTTGMYRSGDPNKLYQRFKESPESTITKEYGFFGDDVVSYKGREIPEPEMEPGVVFEDGKLSVKYKPSAEISTMHKIGEAAGIDVPRNIALTISSIVDQAFDSDFTKTLDENMPKSLKAEGEMDELIKTGTQIGVGTMLGGSLGGNIQKAAGSIAKGLGSVLGSTAAMDPDTEALIFGPSGLGYQVKKDGQVSDQVLANKLNLLMEAAVMAKPIEWIGNAASFAGGVVKRVIIDQLTPVVKTSARERVVTDDIVTKLNLQTPEAIDEVRQIIRDNVDMFVNVSDDIGTVGFQRTTMSALSEGANKKALEAAQIGDTALQQRMEELSVRAMELEQGAVERGLPATTVQRDKPLSALRTLQDRAVQSKGGIPSIEEAHEQFGNKAVNSIEAARDIEKSAQVDLETLEEGVKQSLREDPQFGELLTKMEKEVDFDIYSSKRDASEKVTENIARGIKKINDTVREKYNAIPEGAAADPESLLEIIERNDEIYQRVIPKELKMITEFDPENPIVDFKFLHNQVLPKVNAKIAQLRNSQSNDFASIDALTELRKNIAEDQLDFLIKGGDADVAQKALEARDYYKKTVPFRDPSSPIGQMFDAYDEAYNGFLKNAPENQKYRYNTTLQQGVENISEKRIGFGNQIMDFYGREEVGGNPKDIVQVYLGDVAADMTRKLSETGGISKINPDDIINNLGPTVAGQIKKNDPESWAEINAFVNKLRQAKGNVEEQKRVLREAQKLSLKSEKEVYNSVLGNFLDSEMGIAPNAVGKGDGYQTLKAIFRKEGKSNQVRQLMEQVGDNPTLKKGVESGFYTHLREMAQNSTTGLNSKEGKKLLDDEVLRGSINSLNTYGDIIFGADSKELKGYKIVLNAVLNEREKRSAKSIAAFPKNAVRQSATAAVNTAVTMYFGVLNRMGAIANRVGSTAVRRLDPEGAMVNLLDQFHQNPDEAMRMLDDMAYRMKSGKPSDIKKAIWTTAVRTGVFDPQEENFFIRTYDQIKNIGSDDPVDQEMQNLQ